MEDEVRAELAKLIDGYGLLNAPFDGNEERAVEGEVEGNPIRVELYGGWDIGAAWLHVELAFGQIRHTDGRSRTHLGERGVVWAASDFGPGVGGSALPGNDIGGLRWRVSAVAPRCRTSCQGPAGWRDGYVNVGDIVEHLRGFEASCAEAVGAEGDLFLGAWESALPGW